MRSILEESARVKPQVKLSPPAVSKPQTLDKSTFSSSARILKEEGQLTEVKLYLQNEVLFIKETGSSGYQQWLSLRWARVEFVQMRELEGFRFYKDQLEFTVYFEDAHLVAKWLDQIRGLCVFTCLKDFFELGECVKAGLTSSLYLGKEKLTGAPVSIKTISKESLEADFSLVSKLMNQIDRIRNLEHPSLRTHFLLVEEDREMHIVSECCQGGNFQDRITLKGSYSEEASVVVLLKILSALVYLEESQLVHRKICPQSVLLLSQDSDVDVKIAGFDLMRDCSLEGLKGVCGRIGYMPPEMLALERYRHKADVYSAGLLFYFMLTGQDLFSGQTDEEVLVKNYQNGIEIQENLQAGFSKYTIDLFRSLTAADPSKRPSAREALQHPFFTSSSNLEAPEQDMEQKQKKVMPKIHGLEEHQFMSKRSTVDIDLEGGHHVDHAQEEGENTFTENLDRCITFQQLIE